MRKYFWPAVVIIAALFIIFGTALAPLYTDWLWFKDLGYQKVFETILFTRIKLGLMLGLLFFAVIYGNLWYARRIAPPPSPMGLEQQLLERLGSLARRGIGLLLFLGSIVISAMVGLEAATHWEKWLMYFNATSFGTSDPVFGKDIGFYVFQLPLVRYLYNWLFFALVVAAMASAGIHYADEAIEVFGNRIQFAPKVKAHLFTLVAAMFFLKAFGYRLAMYDLLFTPGTHFDGAAYTQVNASIPAMWIMTVAVIIGGLLVLYNITRRGIGYATAALVGVIGLSVVVGSMYPGFIQKFQVEPNELQAETPYIERAIKATREAYGLTNVAVRDFPAESVLTAEDIAANSVTIENIRLWDQGHLQDAYKQIQTIQQYYTFVDVDVDRYWLKDPQTGEKRYRQVWLSPRELSTASLPAQSQTWVNKHLQYTHGYGFCMSPVNEVTTEGLPRLFVYDIPPRTSIDMPLNRMGLYFGELTDHYVLVDTTLSEFDYPTGDRTATTKYEGDGGVNVGTLLRKMLFAVRFSDINILLNDNITRSSRILYKREIRDRLSSLFPFVKFDEDPYMVVVDGDIHWICDGYTVTDAYPYSQRRQARLFAYNYIRNSVKAVVNAYTGQVDAYIIEEPLPDPIIRTYDRIFPGVLKPISEMPPALREHIRYPEDLFSIQTTIFERYHVTDPTVFYNNSDLWAIPRRGELVTAEEEARTMEPYYVIMKLPNGVKEEFILMTPYIRAGKFNMVSWMCAKCDDPDYGKLVVYNFPREKNVFGPQQVAARARQDTYISQQVTLWSQQGSSVGSGNLLVIPIESSLLYVMPVYLVSTATKIPELKRVIVALGDKVAMEETIEEALSKVIGAPVPSAGPRPSPTRTAPPPPEIAGARPNGEVTRLIGEALSQYRQAQDAQRRGDWAAYGEKIKQLEKTLEELNSRAR